MQKKVLIIDDQKEICDMYKVVLEKSWYKVYIENNWLNWLVSAIEYAPDVIILDIMMPQTNGYEVLDSIRNHSSLWCKIIVNSNLSSYKDEQKALDLWADKFLNKSQYTPIQVIEEMEKLM